MARGDDPLDTFDIKTLVRTRHGEIAAVTAAACCAPAASCCAPATQSEADDEARRMAISDVVNTAALPGDLRRDAELICGCVSGAAQAKQIEAWLAEAGFPQIQNTIKPEPPALIASWAPGRGIEDHVASASIEARKP